MSILNKPVKVDKPVAPNLGWFLFEITLTEVDGRDYTGRMTLMKRPEGTREQHNWFATYRGFDQWSITGQGAKIGSGGSRVPNIEKFPFVLDAIINDGAKRELTAWLNLHKNPRTLLESDVPATASAARPAAPQPPPSKPSIQRPAPVPIPKAAAPAQPKLAPKPIERPVPKPERPEAAAIAKPAPTVPLKPAPQPTSAAPATASNGSIALGNELWVDPKRIIAFQPQENDPRFSGQPRKWFDPVELEKLGTSMKEFEQQDAVTVIPYVGPIPDIDWELVNGERRWRSALAKDLPKIKITVGKRVDKKTQHLRALIQNFCKAGHTPRELSDSLQEQVDAGMMVKELAAAIGLKPFFISKMLSLQRLHPDLKAILDPPVPKKDRLRINEGQILSRIPIDKQLSIWNQAKGEPSRRLVAARLKQLCQPLVIHQRNRKTTPSDVVRSVSRKLESFASALIELGLIDGPTWNMVLSSKDVQARNALLAEFNALERDIQLIKGRIVKEKTVLAKAPAGSSATVNTVVSSSNGSVAPASTSTATATTQG